MRQAILGIELEGYYNRQIQNEMDGKGMEQKESKEEKKKEKKKEKRKRKGKSNKMLEISLSYGSSLKLILSFD